MSTLILPSGGRQPAPAARGSILGTLVAHVLQELHELGALPATINRAEVQSALASGVPLPTDCFAHLFKTATAALAAQQAKDGGHSPLTRLDTELLCRCLLSCRNLEDANQRAADFCTAIQPRGGALTLATGERAAFYVDSLRNPDAGHESAVAGLIDVVSLFSYQQLFGWLIGEPLRLSAVWLRHASQLDAVPFLGLFDAPVAVDQPRTGFMFDRAQLARPVLRQPAELEALLATYPFHLLGGDACALTAAQQVRAFLNAALAQGSALPGFADIAGALDISEATLRRRLRDEGTSYLALREQCLLEAAEYHLRNTDRDIEQIAGALGFSDSTAFRRAFHRWTGLAPTSLRRGSAARRATG